MRSFKSYAVAVLFLASCATDEEGKDNGILVTSEEQTNMRTPAEAMQIAQGAVSIFDDGPIQKSTGENNHLPRTIDYADGVKCITASQAVPSCGDTLMYVVNYTDNQGFAVVSASRNTEELLAVTENGHYNPDGTTIDNPGFRMFMEMAEDYVSNAIRRRPPGDKDTTRRDTFGLGFKVFMWDTTYTKVQIPPKITVAWGQENPEGRFCPNHIAGCVNTAAAQAMTYFRHPKSLQLTYAGRDSSSVTLDWDRICTHKKSANWSALVNNDDCSDYAHRMIAYLCRQLGQLSNSDYSNSNQTGATFDGLRTSLMKLGYTVSNISDYATECCLQPLKENKLILMGGFMVDGEGNKVGHMWVVDGCDYIKMNVHTYLIDPSNPLVPREDRGITTTSIKKMNYINWGWCGDANGYFDDGVFKITTMFSEVNYGTDVKYITIYHE